MPRRARRIASWAIERDPNGRADLIHFDTPTCYPPASFSWENIMASDAQIPIPAKPALPDAWFYVDDGRAAGPMPLAKLRDVLARRPDRGRLDLVWRDGFVSWLKAGEVLELASSVPPAPPPTPYLAGEGSL
jgi:hypothetical protein